MTAPERSTTTPDVVEWLEIEYIHPGQDIRNGKLYYTVDLPRQGDKRIEKVSCVVSSDGQLISADDLDKWNLQLTGDPYNDPVQWSQSSIASFLNGDYTIPDPRELFVRIEDVYRTYVDFPDDDVYVAVSLWVMGTYVYQTFDSFPYIYWNGPKETGKTKVLRVTSELAFNAIHSLNMTVAATFRVIDGSGATLLLDEQENNVSRDPRTQEVRSVLSQGYSRGGEVVRIETVGKKQVPRTYHVYGPKMIANIRGMDDVLEDRCIRITTLRSRNLEIVNREPVPSDPLFQELRDELRLFALTQWSEVQAIYQGVDARIPNTIIGRERQLFKPLFAMAKVADVSIDGFARRIHEERSSEQVDTTEKMVTEVLMDLVGDRRDEETVIIRLNEVVGWLELKMSRSEAEELTEQAVGYILKRLGVKKDKRVRTEKGIQTSQYKTTAGFIRRLAASYA